MHKRQTGQQANRQTAAQRLGQHVMKADAVCSPLRMSTMIRLYLLFHNTVQEHTKEATRPSRMPKTTDSGPWAMCHPLFPDPCARPPHLLHHICAQEQRSCGSLETRTTPATPLRRCASMRPGEGSSCSRCADLGVSGAQVAGRGDERGGRAWIAMLMKMVYPVIATMSSKLAAATTTVSMPAAAGSR